MKFIMIKGFLTYSVAEMMSFSGKLINDMPVGCDTILDKNSGTLHLNYFAPHSSIIPLLYQAIGFILTM